MPESPAQSPALAPPPGNPRFPLFDSVRGLAAIAVVFAHAAFLSGAYLTTWYGKIAAHFQLSVWIFFVISGFLLYRPFVAARAEGRVPSIGSYLRRRVLRVVPAYWVALTLVTVWPGAPFVIGVWTDNWWLLFGFLQLYEPTALGTGLLVAWSLCVEATFYVLLPLYALAAFRLTRRFGEKLGDLLPLALLAAATVVFRAVVATDALPWYWRMSIAGTGAYFAAGMALAWASVRFEGKRLPLALRVPAMQPELAWLAVAGALVAVTWVSPRYWDLAQDTVPVALADYALYWIAATLFVLPAVFEGRRRGLPRRILAWRPVAFVGMISYSLYLWHLPLMQWLMDIKFGEAPSPDTPLLAIVPDALYRSAEFMTLGTVSLLFAIAVGAASYYAIELPFLRMKERKLTAPFRLARMALRRRRQPQSEPPSEHALAD